MGWSNDQLNSLTLPQGATSGARIVISGSAIRVYDAQDNLAVVLSGEAGSDSEQDSWGVGLTMNEGAITAPNSPINGASLSSQGDLTYNNGQSLLAYQSQLPQGAQSLNYIGDANLPWPPTTNLPAAGATVGIMNGSVPMIGGRGYRITMSNILVYCPTAPGEVEAFLYYTVDGSTPTFSDHYLLYAENLTEHSGARSLPSVQFDYQPSSDLTFNFMVAITSNVAGFRCSPSDYMTGPYVLIEDVGTNGLANTGNIIDVTTTPPPPPKQTYTKSYSITGFKSYANNGENTYLSSPDHIYQGYYPSIGNTIGCFQFNNSAILSDTQGATIDNAVITITCQHTYYSAGSTPSIGMSKEGIGGNTFLDNIVIFGPSGPDNVTAGQTIKLADNSFVEQLSNGYVTFCMYYPTDSYQYYAYYATNPTLTVTYTK